MLARPPLSAPLATGRPARGVAARARAAFTLVEVLVVMAILVIIAGAGTIAAIGYLGEAKVKEARLKMSSVERACKAYYVSHDSTWPISLTELVQPTDGGKPLLEGGAAAITDPWGKQFNVQYMTDNFNIERPVITTTDDGGREIKWPDPKTQG